MNRIKIFGLNNLRFVNVQADARPSFDRVNQRSVVLDPQISFVPNQLCCHGLFVDAF